MASIARIAFAALVGLTTSPALTQNCGLGAGDKALFAAEHLVGGQPTPGPVLVRRGYVMQYDQTYRVPRWVAWRAINDYRSSVAREGTYARFRVDPDLWAQDANPVRNPEYDGLYEDGNGYARGHLAPYFISGGNRNFNSTRAPRDPFDQCTIFEINYMSNVAPQYHNRFNGSGGLWYKLETLERERILPRGHTLHVIAGTVLAPGPEFVGPDNNIGVPDLFYRILISDAGVVPFLFVHKRRTDPAGCNLDAVLEACIVTIADIERVSGADFFYGLADEDEARLQSGSGRLAWETLIADE